MILFQTTVRKAFGCLGRQLSNMVCPKTVNNSNEMPSAKTTSKETEKLVWIDMEMTGLNVDKDRIMEIACLITDSELNIVAEGPEIIINQPKKILDDMNEWCTNQHGKTGLTEACLNSQMSLEQAEETILNFLKLHITPKASPLAGNSVYMDRFFLMKHMPKVNDYLHYRIVDVSTIKEICRRWNVAVYKNLPKKVFEHRALNDIRESVAELRFYKNNFFTLDHVALGTENKTTH